MFWSCKGRTFDQNILQFTVPSIKAVSNDMHNYVLIYLRPSPPYSILIKCALLMVESGEGGERKRSREREIERERGEEEDRRGERRKW